MCFHHLDGFFNIAIFVSLKNSQMFLIDPSLDHGFPAVLVGKNRNPASEPFGGLCKSGVVAVTVKNEMEFVGIPVPGLHISGFGSCTFLFQNLCDLCLLFFLIRRGRSITDRQSVKVSHKSIDFPEIIGSKADHPDAYIRIIRNQLILGQPGQSFPDRGRTYLKAFLEKLQGELFSTWYLLCQNIISQNLINLF